MSKKITKFDDSDDDSFDDLSDEISEDDESEDEKVIEENKKEDRLAILGYVSEKLPASDDTDSCVTKIGGLPVCERIFMLKSSNDSFLVIFQ